MEAWPSDDIVFADFYNRTVSYSNVHVKKGDGSDAVISPTVIATKESRKYYMTLVDKDDASKNVKYEIAKVLGGNWDQQFEVLIDGHYYPTPLRWSIAAKDYLSTDYNIADWFAYDGTPDGTPKRPPADSAAETKCAGCHTTGFELKEVAGQWQATGHGEIGIACESCHGPGSKHIQEAEEASRKGEKLGPSTIAHGLKDLTAGQQNQMCAQCHGRASNKLAAKVNFQIGFKVGDIDLNDRYNYWNYSSFTDKTGFFWKNDWAKRNRQQWQDFSKSAHFNKAGMSCLTCHSFHGKWEEGQLRTKSADLCGTCHKTGGLAISPSTEMFEGSPMQRAGVTCVNCHMPKIATRSNKTFTSPARWDTSSHTFLLASPALEKSVGMRNACADCHMVNDPVSGTYSLDELDKYLRTIRESVQDYSTRLLARSRDLTQRLDKLPPPVTATGQECAIRARARIAESGQEISFVVLDGSHGVHNKNKARETLRQAEDFLRYAATWTGDAERNPNALCST
jgi:predicted CXXCH cytochrome family protein